MSFSPAPQAPSSVERESIAALPPVKHGVVYTRAWLVEALLDLAGYTSDRNLVDLCAVEPSTGDGAFVVPIVRRLVASAQRQQRPLSECAGALIAYELDVLSAGTMHRLIFATLRDWYNAPRNIQGSSLTIAGSL